MDALLTAVGIEVIPAGESEESLRKKILTDNYFYNRVLARLVDEWAESVAAKIPMLERKALCNRIVPANAVPAKIPVYWEIIQPSRSTNGQMTIIASHGKESVRWNGDWKTVRQVIFYGERVPSEIAHIYELNFSTPRTDPEFAREQRQAEKEQLEAAMKRQENSGDAALAYEVISRMPKV